MKAPAQQAFRQAGTPSPPTMVERTTTQAMSISRGTSSRRV
ncbi:MAG: hypothetical protein AAYR33_02075 [Acetobacteraceae bacterium]